MAEVRYTDDADRALGQLENDIGRARLLRQIVATLTAIGADPGSAAVRRRSYALDGSALFGVTVSTSDDDWLILWEPDPDGPIVYYIGADL